MNKLCVLGLGYIGLPTVALFASRGFQILGVDVDPQVLSVLKEGGVHIEEPGLPGMVQAAISSGRLQLESEPQPADVFIIAVPTPITPEKGADLSFVVSAARSIVPHLRAGNLVVLESTSPPGTTNDTLRPILEESGLAAGSDFLLAHSPERVMPGRILDEMANNPRVIGGINPASAQAARDLYATVVEEEILLTDCTSAEMVKLMENTFRDVNIALANEFARLGASFGVDVWEAISLANRHPRVEILAPGPGVGGHCISVDPWFLVEAAPEATRLIHLARRINDEQPQYVVDLVNRTLACMDHSSGRREGRSGPGFRASDVVIACLGLTYKADVGDVRESPAIEVVKGLQQRGYVVKAFDPYISQLPEMEKLMVGTLDEAVTGADCLLLLVDHQPFKALDIGHTGKLMKRRLIIDTRNVPQGKSWRASGFEVVRLGDGTGGAVPV